ncbi:LysM peptidoglycan-binding domain-containing protein [Ottowia oryzae]|nr:LysM domain-containing protein [Ottowia oryzae]
MFMRQESHPAPSTPWGNADFAQSPSASLANVGLAAAASVHASEVGANNGALLMSSGALSALPIPPHMRQAMDAVYGLPPRRDGERNFSSGQDLPSGQQDPNDRDALPRQGAEPPLPPGKDGHPLRAKDPIRLPPGKDGTPLRVTGPAERPFSQRRGAPETPGAPENQAASPPVATAQTSAAAGIAPAHPVSQTSPSADPTEIAALELFLAEPANKELITHFGGALEPLPTWTTVGQGIEARYGSDLGGRLYQLQNAQRAVEGEFFKEMDRAKQTPPATVAPSTLRKDEATPESGKDGWVYKASGGIEGDPAKWVFDPGAFAKSYAAGDSPAQRGLANVHGGDPIRLVPAPDTEVGGADSWQMSGVTVRLGRRAEQAEGVTSGALLAKDGWVPSGLERRDFHLDPNRITKLINNEALWFDPVHGFTTDIDNLKPDALDKAMPYIFAAAVTAMTFGAGSTVAAGIAGAAGGGTSGTVALGAATGAVSNAALQLAANGKINFGQLLQSAVAGGVTAGLSKLPGVGEYLDPAGKSFGGRLMAYTGRATVQGAIQAVSGGKFKDGFASGLMSGLAGEVTAKIDAEIADMKGLSATESSALRLLSRAAGSALRVVGTNDPSAGFARDFLGGLMQDAAASHRPADQVDEAASPDSGALPAASNHGTSAQGDDPSSISTGAPNITVGKGDTLERLARQQYGENWRAGLTAMMAANPGITTNRWGSPIIQPGQTLNTPSLDGFEVDALSRLNQTGGQIVANNSRGLDVRAQLQAEQARRAAAQQAAQRPGASGMSQQEAYDRYMAYGGRSNGYANEMGDGYKPTWHQSGGTAGRTSVREVVDRANELAYSPQLTREHLLAGMEDVRTAMRDTNSNEQQLWLQSAALSLHVAGASRGLIAPGETLNSPEMLGLGVTSGAFGGSNASTPMGRAGRVASDTGANYRSAFRSIDVEEAIAAGGLTNSTAGLGLRSLDPTRVGFSQSWISARRPGVDYSFSTLTEGMGASGWVGRPVDVVRMPNGTLTSIDNTRILAARQAGIRIHANIRGFDDPIRDTSRRAGLSVQGITPGTWGEAAQLRINDPWQNSTSRNGQVPNWSQRFPTGSLYDPNVWNGR